MFHQQLSTRVQPQKNLTPEGEGLYRRRLDNKKSLSTLLLLLLLTTRERENHVKLSLMLLPRLPVFVLMKQPTSPK